MNMFALALLRLDNQDMYDLDVNSLLRPSGYYEYV